jgi:uncharacterized protein (UPF0276 family)
MVAHSTWPGQSACAEGVGLSYHPFLHAVMIARLDAYDFIELPLDLYIDPAQSALLDPMDARLRDIAAARPCIWRGSALSLGSVERPDDPAPDPRVIDRIRLLMERAGTTLYSDVIGFRGLEGRDLGVPQSLPSTDSAARWMAARYSAARNALGHPFLLQPAGCAIAAPRSGCDHAAFLRRIVSLADCELLLSVVDLERVATETGVDPADMMNRLPHESIAMLATSGKHEAEWALLSQLVEVTAARAIVIRRTDDLFPLDAIVNAAHRARSVLTRERRPMARRPETEPPRTAEPLDDDPGGLASLRCHESDLIDFCLSPASAPPPLSLGDIAPAVVTRLASHLRPWQVWRERIADTHKARQIAQFLAEDTGHDARQRG